MTLAGSADSPTSHFRAALLAAAIVLAVTCAPLFLIARPRLHIMRFDNVAVDFSERGEIHRLDIARDGRFALDGAIRCDLLDLRVGLDLLHAHAQTPLVEIRVDPEARYEAVAEVLAVTLRARTQVALSTEAPGAAGLGQTSRPQLEECQPLERPLLL